MYGNPNNVSYDQRSSGSTFDPIGWLAFLPITIIDLIGDAIELLRAHPHQRTGLDEKRKNNFEAAIHALKRANEINEGPENYLNLAQCYLQLGQYEDALKNATSAMLIAPISILHYIVIKMQFKIWTMQLTN